MAGQDPRIQRRHCRWDSWKRAKWCPHGEALHQESRYRQVKALSKLSRPPLAVHPLLLPCSPGSAFFLLILSLSLSLYLRIFISPSLYPSVSRHSRNRIACLQQTQFVCDKGAARQRGGCREDRDRCRDPLRAGGPQQAGSPYSAPPSMLFHLTKTRSTQPQSALHPLLKTPDPKSSSHKPQTCELEAEHLHSPAP